MKFAPSVAVSSSFLFAHRLAAAAGQPSLPMTLDDFKLPQADTGVLVYGGAPTIPEGFATKHGDYDFVSVLYPTKGQLTTAQVDKWIFHAKGGAYLLKNGDFYTAHPSTNNTAYIGRAVTEAAPKDEYHLAATGVADFVVNNSGIAYVSTGGELYYCGNGDQWGTTGTSYNQFTKIGTDTDWISIHADPFSDFYNSVIIAQKGSSAATAQLYVIGSNTEGKAGQNTTSGTVTSWSKMSDGNGGTFNVQGWKDVKVTTDSPGAISNDGKLYRWGEGLYGAKGDGTNSDILYPYQVGGEFGDTDWEKLGPMGNVMMAIKGGEIWYCSYSNFGHPNFSNPIFDRTWRQLTSSGGNWEDIQSNPQEVSTSSWTAKYNGIHLVYGISPEVRGNWSSSNLTGSSYTGTGFTELSNHPDYPAGSPTIAWAEFHAINSSSQILILRAT